MILSAAPIIHARTRDVDFRSNLLVVPEGFGSEQVRWARQYILASTRYFESAGECGRRVVFGNRDLVVTGLSIRIADLYEHCGKAPRYHQVDASKRVNYAFIGFVIPRTCIKEGFDVPESMLLEQFERYMELRWEDALSEPGTLDSTKVPYAQLDFPKAREVSSVLRPGKIPHAIEEADHNLDSLCAQAALLAAKRPGFAFCSHIPNSKSAAESAFQVVTAKNADSINQGIAERLAPAGGGRNAPKTKDTPSDEDSKKAVLKKIALTAAILLCILAAILIGKIL